MRFFLLTLILVSVAINPVHARYAKLYPPTPEPTVEFRPTCSKGTYWRWWPQPGCWFRIY